MSIVSNNIKYLRRLNGLTQEQFARKIAIKRSLLGAYEEARANPNLTNLKNMAAAFGITVDNLLKNDLRKIRETPDMSLPLNTTRPMTVSHSGAAQPQPRVQTFAEPQPLAKIIEKYQQPEPEIRMVSRQVTLKPVSGNAYVPPVNNEPQQQNVIPQPVYTPAAKPASSYQPPAALQVETNQLPVFNNQYQAGNQAYQEPRQSNYPTIQWVSKNLTTEYLHQYQNPAFLTHLPSFQLPNLPSGYYRAFESGADFAYPGALLVGTFVRNWYEIKDGGQYLFVLRNHGIVYRTAFNQVKTNGMLSLASDLSEIPVISVALHDVLEVWEIRAFISLQLPQPVPSMEKIGMLVDELQQEIKLARP